MHRGTRRRQDRRAAAVPNPTVMVAGIHSSLRRLGPRQQARRAAPRCATGRFSPGATIKGAIRPHPNDGRRGGRFLTMLRVLSTHLFLNQRLHPGLLELAGRSGAEAVEIFAARQHFDYTSRETCSRTWRLVPFQFAAGVFAARAPVARLRDGAGGRAGRQRDPSRKSRGASTAMDEIKRALETAEHIAFRNMVVHLGERYDDVVAADHGIRGDRARAPGRVCAPAGRARAGGEPVE